MVLKNGNDRCCAIGTEQTTGPGQSRRSEQ